ncbi:MAG: tRNA (N6-isopentenyl adenosine(37)-C2)-methylthiotransferase MiaB [Candidatus Sericytochromatia bacterium]|nr:tRNA (N6-isopentenyl adenosine(37)-C2)-methylthiotransferase MiaB [Candidatus Sericytochromatia bacterium]
MSTATQSPARRVHIETFGCQMNKSDSEKMLGLLAKDGYHWTDEQAEADLILINSCSIRENAVNRLIGHLGRMKALKRQNPELVIGVGGCVPQHEKENLLKRVPHLDIVFGTHTFHKLPELVREFRENQRPIVSIVRQLDEYPEEIPVVREGQHHAWITVQHGCSAFCTFCIVPYTRGQQQSRTPEAVAEEIRKVAAEGYKEITLLGQNINTYGWDLEPATSLGQLLHYIHDIDGIERIRFLTSHPVNMRDDLIDAMAELPKVCEFLHLPLQAGNDEVLKRMRRNHTVEFYAEWVEKIRAKVPDMVLTSDFIVGYPGETEEQFLDTVESVRRFAFDSANTASYSPRPRTPAAMFKDQVDEAVKKERLNHLNQVVREVALQQNRRHLGSIQEVMVESYDEKRGNLKGRTRGNKIVHFEGNPRLIGQIVQIKVMDVTPNSLRGRMLVS